MSGPQPIENVDLEGLLAPDPAQPRVRWSASNQLQTNVVVLGPGEVVEHHVERELDVTLVFLTGCAVLAHGSSAQLTPATVTAPDVMVLQAGTHRSMTAGADGAAYLTAHRRRPSLLPTVR